MNHARGSCTNLLGSKWLDPMLPTLQWQGFPAAFPFLAEGWPRSDSFEACLGMHMHCLSLHRQGVERFST